MTARGSATLKNNWHERDPYDQFVDTVDTIVNPQDSVTFGSAVTMSDNVTQNGTSIYTGPVRVGAATAPSNESAILINTPSSGTYDIAFGFGTAANHYPTGVKNVTDSVPGSATYAIKVDIGGVTGYVPVFLTEGFKNS